MIHQKNDPVRREISSASQAAKKLNSEEVNEKKKVCSETVRRALKSSGMKAVKKKNKTLLAARNHKKRLDFAMRHKDWTVEDWKRVIWSDETKINRMGSDGQKWAWKEVGARGLTDQEVTGTVKFGGGSLMMWGCMTAQGEWVMAAE